MMMTAYQLGRLVEELLQLSQLVDDFRLSIAPIPDQKWILIGKTLKFEQERRFFLT